MRNINIKQINKFRDTLISEEKSDLTVKKYVHDIENFYEWLMKNKFEKTDVLAYKHHLIEAYALSSVNSIISSLNCFFVFMKWHELKIKTVKMQKAIFTSAEKELTKEEYFKLLQTARVKNERLYLIMQSICSTGIRVSEIKFITVEAIKLGKASITCKGKYRQILLPTELCGILKKYAKKKNIVSGPIFVSKQGNPLDRSNIWSDMKKLCKESNVNPEKVFPHNLRHLFARTYYSMQKDIVRLADILGHSNVNTTRIYTIETGMKHLRQIQKLGLIQKTPHNIDYVVNEEGI